MYKRAIMALLAAAVLLLTTGCNLIVKDPEVDKSTVIVEIGDTTITKGEVASATESVLDEQEYEYSYYSYYYGMNYGFDRENADTIAAAQDEAIDQLIKANVQIQKSKELGYDVMSEEDEATAQADAEAEWQSYMDYIKTIYFSETELTGEELDAAIIKQTEELLGGTKDEIIAQIKIEKLAAAEGNRLREYVVKDVTVSDEEIVEKYAADQQAAKDSYSADPDAYSKALMNDSYIYYVPAGYRYIKHILVQFSDEDKTAVSEAQSALAAKENELAEVESKLTALNEGSLTAAEGETLPTEAELNEQIAALTAEKTELEAALTAAKNTAYAALQPTIDEITAKLDAGEDFDALMEQYGQDSGMKNSPTKETGYAVCADSTTYVTEFKDAAMALAAVGDVSKPVPSDADSGIHILKYIGDSIEADVPATADKNEEIKAELLSTKQDDTYAAAVDQWVEESKPVIHKDRLN